MQNSLLDKLSEVGGGGGGGEEEDWVGGGRGGRDISESRGRWRGEESARSAVFYLTLIISNYIMKRVLITSQSHSL